MLTNVTFWLQVTMKSPQIFETESSKKEKLLVISIDTTLSFEHHITSLCKKASQKLHALARIAHYMDFEKRKSLLKAFIISQFNYCP